MGKKQDTTNRILTSALSLMAERGYHGASVKEIATAAGVSEMTVFRHFPSKYAMLTAALRGNSYKEKLDAFFASGLCWDLKQDLGQLMRLYFAVAEKRSEAGFIYLSALNEIHEDSPEVVQDITALKTHLGNYFSAMQQRGRMRQGDPAAMAEVFWQICSGFALSHLHKRRRSYPMGKERYIETALAMVLHGIAAPSA